MPGGEKKFFKQHTLPSVAEKESEIPPVPEKIGPYRIETLLAKGGMSLLYLGFDPDTNEARVVKVLSPEYVNHPEMADHFLWEAKIIGLTSHPNIVKLYDYGKWEEGLYIAMEFIRGVSLRQFLIQQSFSLKRCLDIILQVSYALLHLHTHGVIHRDLKPENILIAEDGEVKVIDFGIAQLHEDEEQPSLDRQIVGTPSYMSPEQKENPQNASFASDIFSLGVITYELILGKLSYGMINLTLLPSGLQKIVGKTLAISPSERYQDIVPFITDLTDYYKSPAIEKDRPGGDQVIEFMEILQRADAALSTFEKPRWPQFEIGIARDPNPHEVGLYLDFFRFANNTMAIILAHPSKTGVTAPIHTAVLRGMIKSLIAPHLATEVPFEPSAFTTTLNALLCDDKMEETFHFHILKLIPYNDTLSYLSCGPAGPLFHTTVGKNTPRTITSDNPLLGTSLSSTFTKSGDTLDDGDLIVFHPFPEESFEDPLHQVITRNVLLSCNRLAEEVLHAATTVPEYKDLTHPKVVLTLHRIS
ncbi:MAG: Serine/threonine-protein kinase PknA [Chlamydiae bacterium]|nr:Serine/threonine-protein kinase PknA [Chlamydiota bacterium]